MGVPNVAYLQAPAVIVDQAIDRLGAPGKIIGDITDGTAVAEAARRLYGQRLRQLLRAVHWGWARKQATLQLLGDATGQSPSTISTFVEQPWTYAYAWPQDAVAGRWMPVAYPLTTQGTATNAQGVPLTTAGAPIPPTPMMPARFLVTSSDQYPIMLGQTAWEQMPDLQRTEGLGPTNRRVIVTDQQNALFVYTRLVTYIEEWDELFREAFVQSLAVDLAPTVFAEQGPKVWLPLVERLKGSVAMALADARVANGNDAGWPQSVDHMPPWITARNAGIYGYNGASGVGAGTLGLYMPWDAYSLGGSVY